MAEHRARAAGQDRRHPSPLIAEVAAADRVDTAVNAVEAAGVDAIRNSAGEEARRI